MSSVIPEVNFSERNFCLIGQGVPVVFVCDDLSRRKTDIESFLVESPFCALLVARNESRRMILLRVISIMVMRGLTLTGQCSRHLVLAVFEPKV